MKIDMECVIIYKAQKSSSLTVSGGRILNRRKDNHERLLTIREGYSLNQTFKTTGNLKMKNFNTHKLKATFSFSIKD